MLNAITWKIKLMIIMTVVGLIVGAFSYKQIQLDEVRKDLNGARKDLNVSKADYELLSSSLTKQNKMILENRQDENKTKELDNKIEIEKVKERIVIKNIIEWRDINESNNTNELSNCDESIDYLNDFNYSF